MQTQGFGSSAPPSRVEDARTRCVSLLSGFIFEMERVPIMEGVCLFSVAVCRSPAKGRGGVGAS
jgi:hypothetical protein